MPYVFPSQPTVISSSPFSITITLNRPVSVDGSGETPVDASIPITYTLSYRESSAPEFAPWALVPGGVIPNSYASVVSNQYFGGLPSGSYQFMVVANFTIEGEPQVVESPITVSLPIGTTITDAVNLEAITPAVMAGALESGEIVTGLARTVAAQISTFPDQTIQTAADNAIVKLAEAGKTSTAPDTKDVITGIAASLGSNATVTAALKAKEAGALNYNGVAEGLKALRAAGTTSDMVSLTAGESAAVLAAMTTAGKLETGAAAPVGDLKVAIPDEFSALAVTPDLANSIMMPLAIATPHTLTVTNGATVEAVTLTRPEGEGGAPADTVQVLKADSTLVTMNRGGSTTVAGLTMTLAGLGFPIFNFNESGGGGGGGSGGGGSGGAICFLGNAPVLTPTGYRRIDSLAVGDMVRTADGRDVAIQRVVRQRSVEPSAATNPYVIPAGKFGATENLAISPRHCVAVPGRGMVEARELGLRQLSMRAAFDYYNLELPEWDNMIVAGVEVESLAPKKQVVVTAAQLAALAATMPAADRAKLARLVSLRGDGTMTLQLSKKARRT